MNNLVIDTISVNLNLPILRDGCSRGGGQMSWFRINRISLRGPAITTLLTQIVACGTAGGSEPETRRLSSAQQQAAAQPAAMQASAASAPSGTGQPEHVLWSMRQWKLSKHPHPGQLTTFWQESDGAEIVDKHTLKIHAGVPVVATNAEPWHMTSGSSSTFISSKRQTDELAVECASTQMAATGPREIVDHRAGEFERMVKVKDHWRHTPEFDEFVMWEIPEGSFRLAGFQTGQLDTPLMAFDTIPSVLEVEGAQQLMVSNAVEIGLRISDFQLPNHRLPNHRLPNHRRRSAGGDQHQAGDRARQVH